MATEIEVSRGREGHLVRCRQDLLRAQVVGSGTERCRVGLLATQALLLGGDVVELDVRLGPGARLDLFDVAGTVAYHGRGRSAAWHVRIALAAGARLTYAGEPLVVSDGADVVRSLELDLAAGAAAAVRDTVVLGRSGQSGGTLRSRTAVRREGEVVLREDQQLDLAFHRRSAGMLGRHRVLDTVTFVGCRPGRGASAGRLGEPATAYELIGGAGTVLRWLGLDLAESPLHGLGAEPSWGETSLPRISEQMS